MKNCNKRPFLLLLLAVGFLLVFGRFASDTVGGYEIKSVDLLADVRVQEEDTFQSKLVALPEIKKEIKKDTLPPGIVVIEDYSDTASHGMKHFYEALRNKDNMDRPVRIAYFGDSFIEGDIYTADLRALLQDKFGGCGIGFTDIASPLADFRLSLPTSFSGWDTRNILMGDSCERHRLGPTQRYSMPVEGAYASLKSCSHYKHLDHFETATLYLRSNYPVNVTAKMNKDSVLNFTTVGDGTIETVRCDYDMNNIIWNVGGDSTVTCFGTSLEGRRGITLDNFSFRGSNGISLSHIPQKQWNAISAARDYDLIVLHFGLNVADKDMLDYDYYQKGLKHTLDVLKQAYPNTSILIVGVSDREDRIDGELKTIPGVKALIKYQQVIASENNVSFWNLYQAMGGEGSIVDMTKTDPKGARLDYTHITREGGHVLAEKFYKSLLYCYDKYLEKTM